MVLSILRRYPGDEWPQMMAMSFAEGMEPSNTIHLAIADAVIGSESRHERAHRTRQVLQRLIAGLTEENVDSRIELLAQKVRRMAKRPEAAYLAVDIASLAAEGWDDDERLMIIACTLARILPEACELGLSEPVAVQLFSEIPGEIGERLICRTLAPVSHGGRAAKIAHLARRLESHTATGDDLELVESLLPLTDDEVEVLRVRLGSPSPSPTDANQRVPDDWARTWRWTLVLPDAVLEGWEDAIATVTDAHGKPDPKLLSAPSPSSIGWYASSPIEPDALAALEPLAAARLVGEWRPSSGDEWGSGPLELARALEVVVKGDPALWSEKAVEVVRRLREPVYVNHFLRGMKSCAREAVLGHASLLRAIELVRDERWPPTILGRDGWDFEADWTGVDSTAVELVGALAQANAEFDRDQLDLCWQLAIDAVRGLPTDLGDAAKYEGIIDHDDPLFGAINSSWGKGLQAVLQLGGWEHRHKGEASARLAVALSEVLHVDGAVGLQLRAVIAASRPFVEAIAPAWLADHFDDLFMDNPITFEQTLKYSAPTKSLYERSFRALVRASRHQAEHAMAWLLIAHLWNEPGYEYEAIMSGLIGSAGAVLRDVGAEIARLGQETTGDEKEVQLRALAFSHRLVDEAPDRVPSNALAGLGRWSIGTAISEDTWLGLTEAVAQRSGGAIDFRIEVAERCLRAQPSAAALRVLTMMLGSGETWESHHVDRKAVEALQAAVSADLDDPSVERLRERLIQRGHHDVQ